MPKVQRKSQQGNGRRRQRKRKRPSSSTTQLVQAVVDRLELFRRVGAYTAATGGYDAFYRDVVCSEALGIPWKAWVLAFFEWRGTLKPHRGARWKNDQKFSARDYNWKEVVWKLVEHREILVQPDSIRRACDRIKTAAD